MERPRSRRRERPAGREREAELAPEQGHAVQMKKEGKQPRQAQLRSARQQQRDQALGQVATQPVVQDPQARQQQAARDLGKVAAQEEVEPPL